MKLELKHLAPYLPYGLKNQRAFHKPKVIDGIVGNQVYFGDTILFINQIQPILRPLSDLTNVILDSEMRKLGHSSHIDWVTIEREHWISFYGRCKWLNDIPYVIINFLFENHYDVFGLIDKRLAININTLKQ